MDDAGIQQFYLQSLISDITGWSRPQERLKKAFAQNEFFLFGQSIINLAPEGADRPHIEIFVRLREEEQNLTPPGTFLPILEHHNFGPRLDRYVLRDVLVWCRTNFPAAGPVIHINLCANTLLDQDFPRFVATELKATELDGDSVCFEIPDVGIRYGQAVVDFARKLLAVKCHIAVGSPERENISFRPIRDLNPNFVKIGGHLIRDIVNEKMAMAKVQAIVRASQTIGLKTIAQHVEDNRTLELVKRLGVDYAQGHGISKPGPLEDFAPKDAGRVRAVTTGQLSPNV